MNIEEIREAKEQLGKSIARLIEDFSIAAGVNVLDVSVGLKTHWSNDVKKNTTHVSNVRITLEQI